MWLASGDHLTCLVLYFDWLPIMTEIWMPLRLPITFHIQSFAAWHCDAQAQQPIYHDHARRGRISPPRQDSLSLTRGQNKGEDRPAALQEVHPKPPVNSQQTQPVLDDNADPLRTHRGKKIVRPTISATLPGRSTARISLSSVKPKSDQTSSDAAWFSVPGNSSADLWCKGLCRFRPCAAQSE